MRGYRPVVCLGLLLCAGLARAAEPFGVQVDPPDRLAKATVWPGEGPDLDLGWNDYLQLRVKLPAGPAAPLVISYGTSTHPGFDAARQVVIPAAKLLRDGQVHTYRLDLGLEVWWRDTLRDLRVELPAGATLDYLEVGDLPGDELVVNTDLNCFVGDAKNPKEKLADCQRFESKHFCFWWSPKSFVEYKGFNPQLLGRRALRMGEECYQIYCKLRGYAEPFVHGEPAKRDGKRYKVNITSWYGGYWMGAQNGFGYLNVNGSGLLDEGWGNPMPHEFGHVVQGAQPGFLTGSYWESHANYLRSLRNSLYSDLFPGHVSDVGRGMLDCSCYQQDQWRLIYADFRAYAVLDDYATDYGLPADIIARLWRDGAREQVLWQKLASVLPAGRSIKDVAGQGLRHWVTLDLKAGDKMKAQLRATPREAALMDQATGADLLPLPAEPGWWRVSWGRAPMRYGYMFHELAPVRDGATVNAALRGLDLPGTGEDWRWSLVAQRGQGQPRYSPVFKPGPGSLALQPGEDRVFLVVVATPDQLDGSQHGAQSDCPLDRHPNFKRYPYEVRLEGARPRPRAAHWPLPAGHPHPNGGGFVADTANVAATAFVGPEARVLDQAQVRGQARVEDQAVVCDRAVLDEQASVRGCAVVRGASQVKGRARLRDHVNVTGNSRIEGDALLLDSANLDNCKVRDQVVCRGCCQPWNADLSGTAILEYDYSMDFPLSDGVHYNHVPWGGWWKEYWCTQQRKPRGLTASYRFDEPDGQVALDEFGSLHATLRGQPARVADAEHGTTLALNGRDQWLELDRSVTDSANATIALWCKPAGERWRHLAWVLAGDQTSVLVDGQPAAGAGPKLLELGGANLVGRGFAGQLADVRCYNVALTADELKAEAARTGALLGAFLPEAKACDGTSTMFHSGIRNDRERTLAGWVKPMAAPGYRPIFCSRDERNGARQGCGLGVENGKFRARLDGRGWWDTGVAVTTDQWQHVALAVDGATARLFVGGREVAQTAYQAREVSPKVYRLGWNQETEDAKTRRYFSGELRDLRIFGRALTAAEVAALAAR